MFEFLFLDIEVPFAPVARVKIETAHHVFIQGKNIIEYSSRSKTVKLWAMQNIEMTSFKRG